jgi:hypothetical protein
MAVRITENACSRSQNLKGLKFAGCTGIIRFQPWVDLLEIDLLEIARLLAIFLDHVVLGSEQYGLGTSITNATTHSVGEIHMQHVRRQSRDAFVQLQACSANHHVRGFLLDLFSR